MRFFAVLGLACLAMGAELVFLNTTTWQDVLKDADQAMLIMGMMLSVAAPLLMAAAYITSEDGKPDKIAMFVTAGLAGLGALFSFIFLAILKEEILPGVKVSVDRPYFQTMHAFGLILTICGAGSVLAEVLPASAAVNHGTTTATTHDASQLGSQNPAMQQTQAMAENGGTNGQAGSEPPPDY